MDFTEEFKAINKIDPRFTYIARYSFNNNEIKLYIRSSKNNQYLILIMENGNSTLIHPYTIIKKASGKFYINGYMGDDYVAARFLKQNDQFTNFYKSLSKAVLSIEKNEVPGISIEKLEPQKAKSYINTAIKNNSYVGKENKYYFYSRSSNNISPKQ